MKVGFVNLASGYSGGENQTFLMAKSLMQASVELVAVCHPRSPLKTKLEEIGVPIVSAKAWLSGHLQTTPPPILDDVHIFHAHDGRAPHWCSIQKLLFGKPYVITRRIDNPINDRITTRYSYKGASAFIGISSKICEVLRAYEPSVDCYQIPSSPVSYAIDPQRVIEIKKRYKNKFLVIHAASLLEHKGFDTTIAAARRLKETEPSIHFAVLGEGPEKEHLIKTSSDLTNIDWLGKQHDMGNWFEAADALILPSKNEGLGSVLLEAMKARVPVVATKVGGIPDVVKDGETGILIDVSDDQALADALVRLKDDQTFKEFLIVNAEKSMESFDISKTSKLYLEIYKNILNQK